MHLDEMMKKKLELDIEGQVLKVETIAHQRALKLLSKGLFNSKFSQGKLGNRHFLENLLGKDGVSEVWTGQEQE
jgi:hypothetical protein